MQHQEVEENLWPEGRVDTREPRHGCGRGREHEPVGQAGVGQALDTHLVERDQDATRLVPDRQREPARQAGEHLRATNSVSRQDGLGG